MRTVWSSWRRRWTVGSWRTRTRRRKCSRWWDHSVSFRGKLLHGFWGHSGTPQEKIDVFNRYVYNIYLVINFNVPVNKSGGVVNPRHLILQASCRSCNLACFLHFALLFWNHTFGESNEYCLLAVHKCRLVIFEKLGIKIILGI